MATSSVDLDSPELCLIDAGITSLQDVPLRSHLQVLNLHSNYITIIEGLDHLKFLKHLDLSANHIRVIEGLEGLISLKTLNLSCNLLTSLNGLSSLRCLEKLNVSYNQIEDLTGLKSLTGPAHRLEQLDLHSNRLSSVAHVSQCLCRISSLRRLVLNVDGSGNPICIKPGYVQELLSSLPQLQSIDGKDRSGNVISQTEASIPGLDEYLEYLLSSGGEAESDQSQDAQKSQQPGNLITPKIDKALEMFKQRLEPTPSSSNTSMIQSVTDTELSPSSSRVRSHVQRSPGRKTTQPDPDTRLANLEQQIADLIHRAQTGGLRTSSSSDPGERSSSPMFVPGGGDQLPEKERTGTLDSDDGFGVKGQGQGQGQGARRGKKSSIPSYRKSTTASRARKDRKQSKTEDDLPSDHRPKSPGVTAPDSARGPTARAESDDKIRNDIKLSYTEIMGELEKERERRWKAEAAAKKLVDHIQSMSSKAKEEGEMKDIAIEATTRLKHGIMNEREAKLRLAEENETLKKGLQEAVEHLSKSKAIQEEQAKALRDMEHMSAAEEKEKLKQQTHDHKKLQDAMMKSAALSREVDMLKSTCESQKSQIHSLQSLLANREQEHREELKKRYSLGSPEMQAAIQEEVQRAEKEHTQQNKQLQEKIEDLSKQYTSLEDEFREALQIESSRFRQLKEAFETVSEDNSTNKAALLAAQRKDEKSTEIISELTSLVKEQKGRLSELTKAKQEQTAQYRERTSVLEAHVEEARKRMVQLELLKQDNIKLKSTVHGQESVIEGLRAERKHWEQELAQQGVSLAQDRGSLEAKVEAQRSEINMLKKQIERETDGLKIKTKMLEDQTETIRKLKEGLEERDSEIKKCRQENLKIQQSLEDQLGEERTNNQDTQEMLERLRERKQDLKSQVSELEAELEESKKAHSVLNNKWKDKSRLISQLEQQVQEMKESWEKKEVKLTQERDKSLQAAKQLEQQVQIMKESWEKKEVKLTQERDKSLQAANLAIERLKSADDAFRKQLEDKERAFQEHMAQLEEEKNTELEQAHFRVHQVEEEMREMLRENQTSKKATEDKVKRLTQALTDLQSDLYQ